MNKNQRTTTNIKLNNTNIEILKNNFPQCFDKNGDFQIEKFQNELKDNEINFSKESYGIDWLGKSYSRLLASDEATTLLKEDKEFNQKPENINSENLLIKGDNLEVLKHLVGAYYEKIKMIYIDPPYNTGTDGFVYNDDRKFTVNQLKELAGIDEDKAKRILEFIQSNSNSHSAWLTFMYPRLYIAKQLLKDDGVIFISIDDNEVAQLRLIMDEIFGEENFIAELPTIMNLKGNNDEFAFSGTHEYTLVFSKFKSKSIFNEFNINDSDIEEWEEDEIGLFKKGSGLLATSKGKFREDRPYMYFPVLIKNNNIHMIEEDEYRKIYNPKKKSFDDKFIEELRIKYTEQEYEYILPIDINNNKLRWTWGYEGKFITDISDIIISSTRNGYTLNKKQRPALGDLPSKKPKSIFYKPQYSSGNGTAQLKSLFGIDLFPNPKPLALVQDFITIGLNQNDIVLDFFAGSGTTGDAVMQLNKEDDGNRKFILVQLPEEIDEKKNKVAYDFVKNELGVETPTIFEITKERLIRAAKRLKEDGYKGDLGFKIFETMPIWEDYNFEADELNKELNLFDDEKLTADDINALLTTWKTYDGVSLTKNLEEIDLGGYLSYYGNGKLYLMSEGFNTDNLKFMLEKIDNDKNFNPTSIIVFGYKFESKNLREIAENIKAYSNKKNIDIDFITRY